MENNIIKLTMSDQNNQINRLLGKLPKTDNVTQQDYRNCNFEKKRKQVSCLAELFHIELNLLKAKIQEREFCPSTKYHQNNDFLKAQIILHSYFIFLRSYIENLVDFISLYLKDLKNRGIKVIPHDNRFKNLQLLAINPKSLEKIAKIRNAITHSNKEEFTLAFKLLDSGELEFCLINIKYSDLEKKNKETIFYYKELEDILEIIESIPREFSSYVDRLLNKTS